MRLVPLLIIIALIGGGAYYAYDKGYFAKAGEAAENSFGVNFGRGTKLYGEMKYEEAIASFKKAHGLEPEKALEWYQKVLDEYPDTKIRGQVEKAKELVGDIGHY